MKKLVALLVAMMMLTAMLPVMAMADSAIDTSEHVVITYLVTGDIPTNRTEEVLAKINEKLTEKVNAELKIRWIEWTDWTTKYNLALATQSGDIDLIGTATDWLNAWPNIQKGAFLPLSEDMLKTYAPKTWEQVPAENWELCKYNGEIYLMPEDHYAQWTNHGFMYRGDWAREAGLENGVHSWADLAVYFQYIKDNKPDVIPWDANGNGSSYGPQMAGGWQTSHTTNVYIEGIGVDLFYGVSKDDPYTLSNYYIEGDELVNFAKEMKKWADAGYWRTDVLNYTGDVAAEMEEGKTGAHQHHTQTWTGERTTMEKKQPGSDLGFFWFGEEMNNVVGLNITHGAMAVAQTSKNPERALMVYDLMRNDPEIYRLMQYGIEGDMYTIDENGYIATMTGTAYAGSGEGKLVVAGSSSVSPVMEKLIEAYMAKNTGAEIELQESDSSSGMSALAEGVCDIGMASRDLKDSELEQGLIPQTIATDGIAVIVNNDNTTDNLSKDDIKAIYTGEKTTW